eukprot:2137673-Rhodomonas_salina.1
MRTGAICFLALTCMLQASSSSYDSHRSFVHECCDGARRRGLRWHQGGRIRDGAPLLLQLRGGSDDGGGQRNSGGQQRSWADLLRGNSSAPSIEDEGSAQAQGGDSLPLDATAGAPLLGEISQPDGIQKEDDIAAHVTQTETGETPPVRPAMTLDQFDPALRGTTSADVGPESVDVQPIQEQPTARGVVTDAEVMNA